MPLFGGHGVAIIKNGGRFGMEGELEYTPFFHVEGKYVLWVEV